MRRITGIAAILLLAVALNIAVATQTLFEASVLVPLAVSLVAALLWLVLLIKQAASTSLRQGRVMGSLNAALASTFFLGICMVLYVMAQSMGVSLDLTQEGRRSLSPQTIQVLEAINKEVTVTCFFLDLDDEFVLTGHEKSERFLEQCLEYTDLLKVEIKDPQLDVGVQQMEAMGLNFASPQGTIVIHSGARKRVITLGGGSPRLEERDFTNALINVVRASEPKVAYLTGHNEADMADDKTPAGAGGIIKVLFNESYLVEPLRLDLTNPEIPRDYDILVINNLRQDLHPNEVQALEKYMDDGGRLFLILDPWLSVQDGVINREVFRPWLEEHYGVNIASNLAMTNAEQRNQFELNLSPDNTAYNDSEQEAAAYRGAFNANHPTTHNFDQTLLLSGVRTVSPTEKLPEGVVATTLLRSPPHFWAETDLISLQQGEKAQHDVEELQGPLSVAMAVSKTTDIVIEGAGQMRQARMLVVGNAGFATNELLTAIPGHLNFLLNGFAWLAEAEELIAIRPTGKEDPPLVLNAMQQRVISWVAILFTVQAIVIAGFIMYLLRRKHQ